MTRRARTLAIAGAIALLALAAWLFTGDQPLDSGDTTRASSPAPPTRSRTNVETQKRSNVVAPRSPIDSARAVIVTAPAVAVKTSETDRSPLANDLHAPGKTGMQDVAIVMDLFTGYRGRFHGFPVGEDNAAFVRALTGHNPGRIALLPPDHPAIDAQGQLLDRWGSPFFFHLLSHDALEIRSAGPDQKLYSADDLIKQSPQVEAATVALREN